MITLIYLDARVLAEPIRLALTLAGIPFNDERWTYDDIQRRRDELPFGQVPVLVENGTQIAQTPALIRWTTQRTGFFNGIKVDSIEASLADIRLCLRPQWYGTVLGRSPVDGQLLVPLSTEQKKDVEETLNTLVLPARFKQLENQVEGPYFCEKMSLADLSWYNMCIGILEGFYCHGIQKTTLKDCPKLINLAKTIHFLPQVQKWNQDHGYPTEFNT